MVHISAITIVTAVSKCTLRQYWVSILMLLRHFVIVPSVPGESNKIVCHNYSLFHLLRLDTWNLLHELLVIIGWVLMSNASLFSPPTSHTNLDCIFPTTTTNLFCHFSPFVNDSIKRVAKFFIPRVSTNLIETERVRKESRINRSTTLTTLVWSFFLFQRRPYSWSNTCEGRTRLL